jgi:DivIVA domain-containing protein
VKFRRHRQPVDQPPPPAVGEAEDEDAFAGGILDLLTAHAPDRPETLLGAQAVVDARFRVSSPEGYQESQVDAFCQDVVDTLTYYEQTVADLHAQVEQLTKQNTELRMTIEVFRVYGRPVVDESGEYVTEEDAQQSTGDTAPAAEPAQVLAQVPAAAPPAAVPAPAATAAAPAAGLAGVVAARRPTAPTAVAAPSAVALQSDFDLPEESVFGQTGPDLQVGGPRFD